MTADRKRIVERLIFESGRPILMCPQEFSGDLPASFDDVVIAWDHTAPAARAVADALPIASVGGERAHRHRN